MSHTCVQIVPQDLADSEEASMALRLHWVKSKHRTRKGCRAGFVTQSFMQIDAAWPPFNSDPGIAEADGALYTMYYAL